MGGFALRTISPSVWKVVFCDGVTTCPLIEDAVELVVGASGSTHEAANGLTADGGMVTGAGASLARDCTGVTGRLGAKVIDENELLPPLLAPVPNPPNPPNSPGVPVFILCGAAGADGACRCDIVQWDAEGGTASAPASVPASWCASAHLRSRVVVGDKVGQGIFSSTTLEPPFPRPNRLTISNVTSLHLIHTSMTSLPFAGNGPRVHTYSRSSSGIVVISP